jgi:hypothetical protein
MRVHCLLACLAAAALPACTEDESGNQVSQNGQAVTDDGGEERVHLAPKGEGGSLGQKLLADTSPVLNLDDGLSEAEQAELKSLIDATKSVLASDAFKKNMEALKQTYSKVWLSKTLQFKDSAGVHTLIAAPASPATYVPTRVYLEADEEDTRVWVDADSETKNGNRMMRLGRGQLEMFRSANVVEKSCPINSLAHEITHTLSRTTDSFSYAITDTGSGAVGSGTEPMASYLAGAVAQCTYLQDMGRVTAEGLEQCVVAFKTRPKFDIGRCSAFQTGEVVKWPKDKPKP